MSLVKDDLLFLIRKNYEASANNNCYYNILSKGIYLYMG